MNIGVVACDPMTGVANMTKLIVVAAVLIGCAHSTRVPASPDRAAGRSDAACRAYLRREIRLAPDGASSAGELLEARREYELCMRVSANKAQP